VPRGFQRREVLVIIRVQELVYRVKRLLVEWEGGGRLEAVREARPCPCGCGFRHLHGHYRRFVVVSRREMVISVPRLLCPACGKTSAVLPRFLAPRSPYPWLLRQAAVVSFLDQEGGYRAAGERFGLDWQLLWSWVEALARAAKVLLASLLGSVLRHVAGDSPLLPSTREAQGFGARARSPAKRESLAAIGPLLVTGYRLWQAGMDLGLPWGRPDPAGVLGFIARIAPALT